MYPRMRTSNGTENEAQNVFCSQTYACPRIPAHIKMESALLFYLLQSKTCCLLLLSYLQFSLLQSWHRMLNSVVLAAVQVLVIKIFLSLHICKIMKKSYLKSVHVIFCLFKFYIQLFYKMCSKAHTDEYITVVLTKMSDSDSNRSFRY